MNDLFYNFLRVCPDVRGFRAIKTEDVFSIIREVNEILSLTNEPAKLVNTALDALSQVLNIQCCWIQTFGDSNNGRLFLAADRGFSDKMRHDMVSMNMEHDFSRQIIGVGRKIIVPDLDNDGVYGLSSFKEAGYKWLVAVPLMTYRVYGILGTASRNKKLFEKETADLIMAIAGLVAGALVKAHLSRGFQRRGKLPYFVTLEQKKESSPPVIKTETAPDARYAGTPPVSLPKNADTAFHSHMRKMESFRKTHP